MLKYCDKDGIEKTIIDSENINDYVQNNSINSPNNSINAADELIRRIFDAVYPVGVTYMQYPQQKSPVELFAGTGSQWKVLNYNGAVFRAEGGKALAFCEKGQQLTLQTNQISSHNHSMSHTHNVSGNTDWMSQNASGTITADAWGAGPVFTEATGNATAVNLETGYGITTHGDPKSQYKKVSLDVNHYHSFNMTSGGSSVANTGSSGSDETRMDNYTVRVWVRTA